MARITHLWTLLCVLVLFQALGTRGLVLEPRQDDKKSPSASPTPTSAATQDEDSSTLVRSEDDQTTSSIVELSSSVVVSVPTSTPTEEADDGDAVFDAPIPEGELPLPPRITPGWSVAGVLLLTTGVVHGLVGIKRPWLHTFLSTAYLTALGITVLIIYVMVPPIPLAVQGAYVVAATVAGLLLGGAACFFKEVTEGLGCMLGGFCLSMWLLCLRSGGLLAPDSAGKIVLIACFTLASFGLYFSRWTRDYALMATISFSGATAAVLGIDCFSRAGLKEFWAYMWHLNDDLFPLGTTTYPVTRGIEVEIASIIILSVAGIISQLKLWRVVKERRAKTAAEREQGQRDLKEEEETVGRAIEAQNARERRIWERRYGNADQLSTVGSIDSGFAQNPENEKHHEGKSSASQSTVQVQAVEMDGTDGHFGQSEVLSNTAPQSGLMVAQNEKAGVVTVRVAHDDTLPSPADAQKTDQTSPNTEGMQQSSWLTHPLLREAAKSPSPAVVPVPFQIPRNGSMSNAGDNRSSIATFADDEAKQHTVAKRSTRSSTDVLSRMSRDSPLGGFDHGDSFEQLVMSRTRTRDDNGSIAATLDLESLDGDDRSLTKIRQLSVTTDAQDVETQQASNDAATANDSRKYYTTESTLDAEPLSDTAPEADTEQETPKAPKQRTGMVSTPSKTSQTSESARQKSQAPESVKSDTSTPASLTPERLPAALSKVALSYRTNEWAKYLSRAETPMPDVLQLEEHQPETAASPQKGEAAAPLNLSELQQTAHTATPEPHLPRSNSVLSRANSYRSVSGPLPGNTPSSQGQGQGQGQLSRQTSTAIRRSSMILNIQPINEEDANSSLAVPKRGSMISPSLSAVFAGEQSPIPGVVSYSSPQTLIGQRDAYLRNKSNPTIPQSMTMPEMYPISRRASSEAVPFNNRPVYATSPLPQVTDADDLPLSQRKELMRRSSLIRSPSFGSHTSSAIAYPQAAAADSVPFDSHQPSRQSSMPTEASRQSQLAAFRQSVQMDIRSGSPVTTLPSRNSFQGTPGGLNRQGEVQRNINSQRSFLMGQKEAEAQKREMDRWEREKGERAFAAMMQSGQMIDAHREKLREMQKAANVRE